MGRKSEMNFKANIYLIALNPRLRRFNFNSIFSEDYRRILSKKYFHNCALERFIWQQLEDSKVEARKPIINTNGRC